jgi:hypothetical protein
MRKLITVLTVLILAGAALAGDTEFTGFVDGAWFWDTAASNGEFDLDQVEIDVIHQASEQTLLRADLEWIRDGDTMTADVEQAFMTYTLGETWDFSFGKFNAPIGFELLDPVDMYQYSHALVFDYGLPTNLTGASLATAFGPGFDIVGHVSNGWDANGAAGPNVTWGGRLGYAGGGFAGGLSAISGKQEAELEGTADPVGLTRTVFDADLAFVTGSWTFGGEFNRGEASYDLGSMETDLEWTAYLVMTHLDYSAWGGLTLRYDAFDDQDGYAFGLHDGQAQTVQSLTICPTFSLDEGFGALVELRWFKSDQESFTDSDGAATDTSTQVAAEFTYSW